MDTKQVYIDEWIKSNLVCPRDHRKLTWVDDKRLVCESGHFYPVIDGVPVMLVTDVIPTQERIVNETLSAASDSTDSQGFSSKDTDNTGVDPYVRKVIGATCGVMYNSLINKLREYPIPNFPLRACVGKNFVLDIGCNWGRWSLSAARAGYLPIGIDHNLEAVLAARRVARKMDFAVHYLVADARFMPFCERSLDTVFSYSVMQHFSNADFLVCLKEISRVMKEDGCGLFQMPNKFGIRNFYQQTKTSFKKRSEFDVVYRSPRQLNAVFSEYIGRSSLSVDGFFSLNPQPVCKNILPLRYRLLIGVSEILKRLSKKFRILIYLADSLYVYVRRS